MRRGAGLLALGLVMAFTSPAWSAPAAAPDVLLAAKKKKKKKKRQDDEFGMDSIEAVEDNDSGVGVHRDQEGVDTPYAAEAGGATQLSMLSSDDDVTTDDSTSFSSDGHICFRFGKVFAGPDIGIQYNKTSSKASDSASGTSSKSDTTVSSIRLGPLLRVFFGNADSALNLPFVYTGVAYKMQSTEVKVEGSEASKTDMTGYEAKAGGGVAMFLDSNIALAPRAEYYTDSLSGKPKGATKEEKSSTSGFRIFVELMTFL